MQSESRGTFRLKRAAPTSNQARGGCDPPARRHAKYRAWISQRAHNCLPTLHSSEKLSRTHWHRTRRRDRRPQAMKIWGRPPHDPVRRGGRRGAIQDGFAVAANPLVAVCQKGQKTERGTAPGCAITRSQRKSSKAVHVGWKQANFRRARRPRFRSAMDAGRTVVTRSRPKIEVALPVPDPPVHRSRRRLPVSRGGERPSRGRAVRRDAFFEWRTVLEPPGELCTCRDVMVRGSWARDAATMQRLATMGCEPPDTGTFSILSGKRPGCSRPPSAFAAVRTKTASQLSTGMLLYDAFFRWARTATKERTNWPTNKAKP